jgi:hypothetical protein
MARKYTDGGELPWPRAYVYRGRPRDLEIYRPEEWTDGEDWHAARSSVAHSLGRKCLPEIQAMVGEGPLRGYRGW